MQATGIGVAQIEDILQSVWVIFLPELNAAYYRQIIRFNV